MEVARYRPAIDGLRSVAVLAVCVFHLKRQWLPGGFIGVDIFFVISGYLITSILLRDLDAARFLQAKFYQRRIARLFPAYFTVALATLGAAFFIYSDQDLAAVGTSFTMATLSLANLKMLLQGNYFHITADTQPYLHCWSLAVEEQFYLVFPTTVWALHKWARQWCLVVLAGLFVVSLAACIGLTFRGHSEFAFYMLPSRAWELLAGSLLAYFTFHGKNWDAKLWARLGALGLALVAVSLWVVQEGEGFPGYVAALPVLGTALCIGPMATGAGGMTERWLAWKPLVAVGKMSYSLYLWHWPVFSLVDYRLYEESTNYRIAVKVIVTAVGTLLSYYLIESPGRLYLNNPGRRRAAFVFLAVMLCLCIPFGWFVRKNYYIEADFKQVAEGGRIFNAGGQNGSIVLLGDSQSSMYARALKVLATDLGMRLTVATVAGGEPLPRRDGQPPSQLWLDSLAIVKREKPDIVVLACDWRKHMMLDGSDAAAGVQELKALSKKLILITEPPELPNLATREAIRAGASPPFLEDPARKPYRVHANDVVRSLAGGNVTVVDIEKIFSNPDGSIQFLDGSSNENYHDLTHLSGAGARQVMGPVASAIKGRQ